MADDGSGSAVANAPGAIATHSAALDAVAAAVADAGAHGERLVVFDVAGVGGVGKTALLGEVAMRLAGTGARTVRVAVAELAPSQDAAADEVLTSYRRIVEALAVQLDADASQEFRARARASAARAVTPAAAAVARDEIRDAFAELVRRRDTPVVILADDVTPVRGGAITDWLVDLLRETSAAAPVIAVLTRPGGPRLDLPGRIVRVDLRPLTREEEAALLPDRAWTEAVDRWSGGYVAAVALARELAREYPGRPEVLDDPAVVVPRGERLLETLLASLGDDIEREAIEIAAVARRFDAELVGGALAEQRATASAQLAEWLVALPFVEPLGNGAYRVRPFLRLLLGERLRTMAPRGAAHVGSRLDELHELVREAYEHQVVDDAQDRRYASWLTLGDEARQERQLEFLHHALMAGDDRRRFGWLALVHAYLDAFWWWGAYLEYDFCRRLLSSWRRQARPADQPLLEALEQFQASYPPAASGRAGDWEGVRRAVDAIAGAVLKDEPGQMTRKERHVRAILDVFTGNAAQHLDIRSDVADAAYGRAYKLFASDPEDRWCVPWVISCQAGLAAERGRHREAEVLARGALTLAQEVAPADRDWEVEATLHRLIADALWERGERWTAFRDLAQALLGAYAFTGLPAPPDVYSRTFYRETADAALDRVVELLPDTDAAARACRAFASFWAPYWELVGGEPDEHSIRALLASTPRDVAVCLFPPEPPEAELGQDGPHAATVRRVYERLALRSETATEAFGPEGIMTRLRSILRRPLDDSIRPPELPTEPAEPPNLFEPADDPVWPDHWRTFPPQWRRLAEEDERRDEIRSVIDAAVEGLPETWRTVLQHRDMDSWTHADVARRLGIPQAHQTLMLHHARARIRAALADHFAEPAA